MCLIAEEWNVDRSKTIQTTSSKHCAAVTAISYSQATVRLLHITKNLAS